MERTFSVSINPKKVYSENFLERIRLYHNNIRFLLRHASVYLLDFSLSHFIFIYHRYHCLQYRYPEHSMSIHLCYCQILLTASGFDFDS